MKKATEKNVSPLQFIELPGNLPIPLHPLLVCISFPPKLFTLEEAIEYITDDDLIEVTPKSIRLRKKILDTETRMKEMMRKRRAMEAQKK